MHVINCSLSIGLRITLPHSLRKIFNSHPLTNFGSRKNSQQLLTSLSRQTISYARKPRFLYRVALSFAFTRPVIFITTIMKLIIYKYDTIFLPNLRLFFSLPLFFRPPPFFSVTESLKMHSTPQSFAVLHACHKKNNNNKPTGNTAQI